LAGFYRANGRGVTVESDEFNFVSLAVGVEMDHGPNVARLQTMNRQRLSKDDFVVLLITGRNISQRIGSARPYFTTA